MGTVLLDEIGDLPLELQMKLLRALQSRPFLRLGARQETSFDVRIMAATNVDLETARAAGRFRDDLYYRLSVFEIAVPSLRRRGAADVRALIAAILRRFADQRQMATPAIEAAALERLLDYRWPGNVRELENTLERMLVAAAGSLLLCLDHLPGHLRGREGATIVRAVDQSAARIREALERHAFRRGRAAVDLGLSRHQLYRLVKRHGIAPTGSSA
jgi:transcriptional regulator with PAS, ATPase and Fis domain